MRTFAYATGPAYGLLLDAASRDWRQRIRSTDDLAVMLAAASSVRQVGDADVVAVQYGGAEIWAAEQQR